METLPERYKQMFRDFKGTDVFKRINQNENYPTDDEMYRTAEFDAYVKEKRRNCKHENSEGKTGKNGCYYWDCDECGRTILAGRERNVDRVQYDRIIHSS